MPYTPVPTKNTGDTFTANEFNTYIRDNFAAGVPDIFEANGDLAVGTGPDAATRLAVGNNWNVLGVSPNAPNKLAWLVPGAFLAWITSPQTLSNDVITPLSLSLQVDNLSCWDATYNAIKLPSSQFSGCAFLLVGYAVFNPTSSGVLLEVAIQRSENPSSGTWAHRVAQTVSAVAGRNMHLSCSILIAGESTDVWFRLAALQVSGSTLSVISARLQAIMIR